LLLRRAKSGTIGGETSSILLKLTHEVSPGRTGAYHPHFHVLLIVPAKYFEADSLLCIGPAEWRVMWEQCLRADGRGMVDIRVTENAGEVAKYVTKPGAYLKN
jgi:plasmid rolling circle replication initiator protein Rep